MEAPDQIIAKYDVTGLTTTGDWDLIENDIPELDPVFTVSPAYDILLADILNRNTAF